MPGFPKGVHSGQRFALTTSPDNKGYKEPTSGSSHLPDVYQCGESKYDGKYHSGTRGWVVIIQLISHNWSLRIGCRFQ